MIEGQTVQWGRLMNGEGGAVLASMSDCGAKIGENLVLNWGEGLVLTRRACVQCS